MKAFLIFILIVIFVGIPLIMCITAIVTIRSIVDFFESIYYKKVDGLIKIGKKTYLIRCKGVEVDDE